MRAVKGCLGFVRNGGDGMPAKDWSFLRTAAIGRMLYDVFIAPAADVEVDGVRYATICDVDHGVISVSDEVTAENRPAAIVAAVMAGEEALADGRAKTPRRISNDPPSFS
jgi:hypothetical protein